MDTMFDQEVDEGTNANPSVEGAERQRMVAIDNIDFILLCSPTLALFNHLSHPPSNNELRYM